MGGREVIFGHLELELVAGHPERYVRKTVRYTTGKEKAGHMRRNQFVSQQQKDHS